MFLQMKFGDRTFHQRVGPENCVSETGKHEQIFIKIGLSRSFENIYKSSMCSTQTLFDLGDKAFERK